MPFESSRSWTIAEKPGWTNQERWEENFEELVKYKQREGHFPDVNAGSLGRWAHRQRRAYAKSTGYDGLARDRIDCLEAIGFDFAPLETIWNNRAAELEAFHREYGHCKVTKVGRNCPAPEGLFNWCDHQKQRYRAGRLDDRRFERLTQIGFQFPTITTAPNDDQALASTGNVMAESDGGVNVAFSAVVAEDGDPSTDRAGPSDEDVFVATDGDVALPDFVMTEEEDDDRSNDDQALSCGGDDDDDDDDAPSNLMADDDDLSNDDQAFAIDDNDDVTTPARDSRKKFVPKKKTLNEASLVGKRHLNGSLQKDTSVKQKISKENNHSLSEKEVAAKPEKSVLHSGNKRKQLKNATDNFPTSPKKARNTKKELQAEPPAPSAVPFLQRACRVVGGTTSRSSRNEDKERDEMDKLYAKTRDGTSARTAMIKRDSPSHGAILALPRHETQQGVWEESLLDEKKQWIAKYVSLIDQHESLKQEYHNHRLEQETVVASLQREIAMKEQELSTMTSGMGKEDDSVQHGRSASMKQDQDRRIGFAMSLLLLVAGCMRPVRPFLSLFVALTLSIWICRLGRCLVLSTVGMGNEIRHLLCNRQQEEQAFSGVRYEEDEA